MLNTDLSTKATQPFFIYPSEIPPEDNSPLLSFLPLLCTPAVMTMLRLHSRPTSTQVTTIHLDRGRGTCIHDHVLHHLGRTPRCTCLNLLCLDEQKVSKKRERDETSVVDGEKRLGLEIISYLLFIHRAGAGLEMVFRHRPVSWDFIGQTH